jgi:hypothetical protein
MRAEMQRDRLNEANIDRSADEDGGRRGRRRQEERKPLTKMTTEARAIGIVMRGNAGVFVSGIRAEHIVLSGQRGEFRQCGGFGRGGRLVQKGKVERCEEKLKDERRGAREKREGTPAPQGTRPTPFRSRPSSHVTPPRDNPPRPAL